jgi:hypothetical protein
MLPTLVFLTVTSNPGFTSDTSDPHYWDVIILLGIMAAFSFAAIFWVPVDEPDSLNLMVGSIVVLCLAIGVGAAVISIRSNVTDEHHSTYNHQIQRWLADSYAIHAPEDTLDALEAGETVTLQSGRGWGSVQLDNIDGVLTPVDGFGAPFHPVAAP